MVITYKGQRNGDVEKINPSTIPGLKPGVWRGRSIKVEGDEEKEVTVRHENVP